MKYISLVLFACYYIIISPLVLAQVPRTISYQGVLTDTGGVAKPNGNYLLTFRLYDVSSGGTALWEESKSVQIKKGVFSVLLGDSVIIPNSVNFNNQYWLGVQVASNQEMTPRTKLASVPYSLNSAHSDTADYLKNTSSGSVSWASTNDNIYNTNTGNVGIGTTNPVNKLQIGNAPGFTGNHLAIGDGTQGMSFTQYSTTSTWYSSTGFSLMPYGGNGFVGIGNSNPQNHLEIGVAPGFGSNHLAIGNGTQAMAFLQDATISKWFSNTGFSLLGVGSGNGFVGINTATPSTRLQVFTSNGSYGITHTNGTVTIGTYIGSNGGWLGTQSNHPLYFFTNNGNAQVTVATNGYVGIGSITPANKLQIGSMGSTGYSGNDIAFGNGTQASGIAQTASTAWWYSNTNIILMPMGNGHGRVGINTTEPSAPLDVNDYVTFSTSQYAYYYAGLTGVPEKYDHVEAFGDIAPQVSIRATSNVEAAEFDARSDARIKDIQNISNSSNDLETLNLIQIINYTMKDKIKYGNRPFKKVIAQQVEGVYPQVVNKNVNYIPNVYQLSKKIEKTNNGYLLSFEKAHNLNKEAKKLQLIEKSGAQQRYDIISIPSDKEVLINAPDLNSDTVFVYGEQVNDFRTVDYDGLTTLNISATQELSKLVKKQQEEIDAQNAKINELIHEIKELKEK